MARKYTENITVAFSPATVSALKRLAPPGVKPSAFVRGVVEHRIKADASKPQSNPVERLQAAMDELNAAYDAVMQAANPSEEEPVSSPPADRPAFHCRNLVDESGLCGTCGDVTVLHT